MLIAIGRHCPNLREIVIESSDDSDDNDDFGDLCKDADAVALFEGCRQLERLTIECYDLTYVSIIRASECCRNLSFVSLEKVEITAWALESLQLNCPFIQEMRLAQISEEGLQQFSTQWNFPNLVKFESYYNNICDRAILEITQKSPLLKEIEVSHSALITDAGMTHIATNCRNLERVSFDDLSGVVNVDSLIAIFNNNRKLRRDSFRFNCPTYSPQVQSLLDGGY